MSNKSKKAEISEMFDDLVNYKAQLQQVENALLCDPSNPELLKLKVDLEEVIKLTQDLRKDHIESAIKPQQRPQNQNNDLQLSPPSVSQLPSFPGPSTSTGPYTGNNNNTSNNNSNIKDSNNSGDDSAPDEITASLMVLEKMYEKQRVVKRPWKAGEVCLAKWSNGKYYDAVIDSINDDGTVNVTFDTFKNRAVTTIWELKHPDGVSRPLNDLGAKKAIKGKDKEIMKKKKLKKQIRMKEMEEEREVDKKKWVSFYAKNVKKKGGAIKKSIFAAPDTVNGRVGVGTCGISGKPMTDYPTPKNPFRK